MLESLLQYILYVKESKKPWVPCLIAKGRGGGAQAQDKSLENDGEYGVQWRWVIVGA